MADPTYTYDPSSGLLRDDVRLLIPDPVNKSKNPQARFSDQEIERLGVQAGGSVKLAAALACEIIAMDEAKRSISVSINSGMSISRNTANFWLQRAKALRDDVLEVNKVPWEDIDAVDYDVDYAGDDHSNYH
jgi:hypothetical protein